MKNPEEPLTDEEIVDAFDLIATRLQEMDDRYRQVMKFDMKIYESMANIGERLDRFIAKTENRPLSEEDVEKYAKIRAHLDDLHALYELMDKVTKEGKVE